MYVCTYVLFCVGEGLAMGRCPVRGVLPKCIKDSQFLKLILNRNRSDGLVREPFNDCDWFGCERYKLSHVFLSVCC